MSLGATSRGRGASPGSAGRGVIRASRGSFFELNFNESTMGCRIYGYAILPLNKRWLWKNGAYVETLFTMRPTRTIRLTTETEVKRDSKSRTRVPAIEQKRRPVECGYVKWRSQKELTGSWSCHPRSVFTEKRGWAVFCARGKTIDERRISAARRWRIYEEKAPWKAWFTNPKKKWRKLQESQKSNLSHSAAIVQSNKIKKHFRNRVSILQIWRLVLPSADWTLTILTLKVYSKNRWARFVRSNV